MASPIAAYSSSLSALTPVARAPAIARAAASSTSTLTAAQAVAAFSANSSMKAVIIQDSAANIKSNFDALKSVAAAGKIGSIKFTDTGKQTIALTASNLGGATTATQLIAKLSGATLKLSDSASNIQNNLAKVSAQASKLSKIEFTDAGRPSLTLSPTEYKASSAALAKMSGASITVRFSGSSNQYRVSAQSDGSITTTDLYTRTDESQKFKGVHFFKFTDTTTIASTGNSKLNAMMNLGTKYWWSENADNIASSSSEVALAAYALKSGASASTLSYSFMGGTPPTTATATDKAGWAAMDATQKQAVRDAFSYLSTLINVSFTESAATDGSADINFATNTQASSAGYANYPNGSGAHNVFVMLANNQASNNASATPGTFSPGGYGWQTVIHEIGHALGLKHPGNYNAGGGGAAAPYLSTANDTQRYTVMSYKAPADGTVVSRSGTSLRASSLNPSTYMPLDIATLQFLYGANTSGNAAAYQTTTFSSTYTGMQTLWAPTGVTLNASATTRSNIVDLREGSFSSINAVTDSKTYLATFGSDAAVAWATKYNTYFGLNNVGLSYGSKISSATGGRGNDAFYASTYDSVIDGGAGTDLLYLTGKRSDWDLSGVTIGTQANKDGSLAVSGSGTVRNASTGADLSVSNIEKIKFYDDATLAQTHSALDISA